MESLNKQHMDHIMDQVYGQAPVIPYSRNYIQAKMLRAAFGLVKPKGRKNKRLKSKRKK